MVFELVRVLGYAAGLAPGWLITFKADTQTNA